MQAPFANRINRSVESGDKLRQNHATPHDPASQLHDSLFFDASNANRARLFSVPASVRDLCFPSLRLICEISLLRHNGSRLHHRDPGRHVATPPIIYTHSPPITGSITGLSDTLTISICPYILSVYSAVLLRLVNVYFCTGLRNVQANPLPQRCSNVTLPDRTIQLRMNERSRFSAV